MSPAIANVSSAEAMSTTPTLDAILHRMGGYGTRPAVFWRGRVLDYSGLIALIDNWRDRLARCRIAAGTVCAFVGDYSPESCSLFFALMKARAIALPLTGAAAVERAELLAIAGAEHLFRVNEEDRIAHEFLGPAVPNPLIERFRTVDRPGLIVFTSGSSGIPKGILHDCERVVGKFANERRAWRTVQFLMMDHFGGFNTLLSAIANGGAAVCAPERVPDAVCREIAWSQAELLPTTPTFLNLLLASGAWRNNDMSSLKLITYGTELMPEATLRRIRMAIPQVQLKQTYGLSEVGVLRSESPDESATWLRVGGDGFETKIVDGTLWVRSKSNMVGYLNAPNSIAEDGWMNTGDFVEERDGFIRFLGRESDVINVGGQKVFPNEVERVLLEADNIIEATVYAIKNSLFGQVACAAVAVEREEPPDRLKERLRQHCLSRLAKFKVPMRMDIVPVGAHAGPRFKTRRGPSIPDQD